MPYLELSLRCSESDQPRYEGALVGLAIGDAFATMIDSSGHDAATLIARARESEMWTTGAQTAMSPGRRARRSADGPEQPVE